MSNFLDNYETANDTIIRFRKEYPTGRIVTHIQEVNLAAGTILIRAEIFREFEDTVPSAVDIAYGNVATLPQNMKKWFVEDCSTSAISRAIKLLSPSTTRPSREDMARVEYEATPSKADDDLWATLTVTKTETSAGAEHVGNLLTLVKEDASPQRNPFCSHGEMRLNKSKPGAAKSWSGYFCPAKDRDSQCTPIWL
jgi:hypothetical protein